MVNPHKMESKKMHIWNFRCRFVQQTKIQDKANQYGGEDLCLSVGGLKGDLVLICMKFDANLPSHPHVSGLLFVVLSIQLQL